ncbi:hypothetical protein TNCV_350521 [Trichonephila clavipes]|nr:hypothetical protein TNCV_350521 [Trichonephila clavipes]
MRDHSWHAFSKGSSSITGLNCFPGWLAFRIFRRCVSMWSMVVQRLTQITHPAATPEQLWQRVEAAWYVVSQKTSKVSLNQCRGVWQR